ncbi:MAG: signal peptidase I [Pseudomonadota bacterium]
MSRLLIVLFCLAGAAVWACLFIWRPYYVPGGSMKPTLHVSDYIFSNKLAYGADGSGLTRGDVVVYRHPGNGLVFLGRVVGLPQEQVQLIGGQVHLNGVPFEAKKAEPFTEPATRDVYGNFPRCGNKPAPGETCLKESWQEITPEGRVYTVLDIEPAAQLDNTAPFEVPLDHLFVLGDNRDNSVDSRIALTQGGVGFVPFGNLIGRVDLVAFSLDLKPGRMLKRVR